MTPSTAASRGRMRIRAGGYDVAEWPAAGGTRFAVAQADDGDGAIATIRIRRRGPLADCLVVTTPAARGRSLRGLAEPLAQLLAPSPRVRIVLQQGRRVVAVHEGPRLRTLARALSRTIGTRPRGYDARRASRLGIPDDYGTQRGIDTSREPARLAYAGVDIHQREQWLAPEAARDWQRMQRAAAADGIELQLVSAFRPITYQARIVERKLARGDAIEEILRVNAAPGFSEHHTGRALDLTTPGARALEEEFELTPAFAW
ncbi:MAG TPA: D-alanyl-D-alanine carboxypeptidase family protein, partial [Xanthomonadales bacterium]|nr:D-alanyl-D-alanine carboxypeptidase family protein [Xanthomonadales bacterium]